MRDSKGLYQFQETSVQNFPYPGKYFVHFSAKLSSGEIEHRTSPFRLTEITSNRDVWVTDNISDVRYELFLQSIDETKNYGTSLLVLGAGMIPTGLALISPSIQKRNDD